VSVIGGGGSMSSVAASKAAGMYMYEANQTIALDVVDTYQAVIGFSEAAVNTGFTYLASATGAITNTEDNGGVLRCTDAGHGLTTGQYIAVHGMGDTAHDGQTRVTAISVDVFDCDDIAYSSDSDTGNWSRGSSLTVDSGGAGNYRLAFSASMRAETNNNVFKVELFKNATGLDEFAILRKISTGADVGNAASSGLVALSEGDTIWMAVENTTDATDIILDYANVNAVRI